MADRTIEIPEHWTAEQADAVIDFIHALETAVFLAYEKSLTDLAVHQSVEVEEPITDLDDDGIPF